MVQWLRIHLPMQGMQVRPLVQDDLTCCGATNQARAPQLLRPARLEPLLCNEKPIQWAARAPPSRVAPPATTRESPCIATKTQHSHKEMKNRAQNPHDQPDQEMQKKHLPKFNAPHDELRNKLGTEGNIRNLIKTPWKTHKEHHTQWWTSAVKDWKLSPEDQ